MATTATAARESMRPYPPFYNLWHVLASIPCQICNNGYRFNIITIIHISLLQQSCVIT